MSTRVFSVLVSSGGFGGSFSAGGRPRFLLTFSPVTCPACRTFSPCCSPLRFLRLMSSSMSSREPFSPAIGWGKMEGNVYKVQSVKSASASSSMIITQKQPGTKWVTKEMLSFLLLSPHWALCKNTSVFLSRLAEELCSLGYSIC